MLLVALLVVSFFFPGLSGFAIARISAPDCSLSWEWSFNSLGQNACTVAAFMMSTCYAGSFTIDPLQPGSSYTGPGGTDDSNLCKCSTVGYSLISACARCQGEHWVSWSEYVTNCTETLPPSFPNPVPSGTSVPMWALLDVTKQKFWSANKSFVVGDSPEVGPGRMLGPSGTPASASGPTTSSAFDGPFLNTTTPVLIGRHSSNKGSIIGGIIGGVTTISILVAALFFYRRWKRSLVQSPVFEGDIAFDPHMDQALRSISSCEAISSYVPGTPTSLSRPYCFDYPITHSECQVSSPPPAYVSGQVPSLSLPSRSPYAVGTMPSSQAQGNHGLPTARFYPSNRSQQ